MKIDKAISTCLRYYFKILSSVLDGGVSLDLSTMSERSMHVCQQLFDFKFPRDGIHCIEFVNESSSLTLK